MSRGADGRPDVRRLGEVRHRLRHELRIAQVRVAGQAVNLEQARSGRAARACGRRRRHPGRAPASGTARPPAGRRLRSPAAPRAPRRRLRTSSSIALSRSSTSSSSISYSLLRVTRKTRGVSSSMPGNRSGRCRRMTVSSGGERHGRCSAGSGTKRGSTAGHLHHGEQLSSSLGRCSSTARLSDLLSRCGNGWPGSMASGVSTGKTSLAEHFVKVLAVRLGQVLLAANDNVFAFQGRQHRPRAGSDTARSTSCRTSLADAVQLFRRRHPVGAGAVRRCRPAPSAARPPTRTMKNSSRLELKMARNLSRSRSGTLAILGLLQHPAIEFEPAQLAVEIQGWIVEGLGWQLQDRLHGPGLQWRGRAIISSPGLLPTELIPSSQQLHLNHNSIKANN